MLKNFVLKEKNEKYLEKNKKMLELSRLVHVLAKIKFVFTWYAFEHHLMSMRGSRNYIQGKFEEIILFLRRGGFKAYYYINIKTQISRGKGYSRSTHDEDC